MLIIICPVVVLKKKIYILTLLVIHLLRPKVASLIATLLVYRIVLTCCNMKPLDDMMLSRHLPLQASSRATQDKSTNFPMSFTGLSTENTPEENKSNAIKQLLLCYTQKSRWKEWLTAVSYVLIQFKISRAQPISNLIRATRSNSIHFPATGDPERILHDQNLLFCTM